MNRFIKKHEFNYIKKCLSELNDAFINCKDSNIIAASKAYIQDKIWNKFSSLSDEEKELLNIDSITEPLHITNFTKKVYNYVYGMESLTTTQINKIFKKEKKLKAPILNYEDKKLVYLGWIDPAIKKLLIVYNYNGKPLGMACRLSEKNTNNTHICALCNHIGPQSEVNFVSPICKTYRTDPDAYKSLGFYVCIDSEKCNERITSTEKLEKIIKEVNNIK